MSTDYFAESLEKACQTLQMAESDVCESAKLAGPVAGISVNKVLNAIIKVRGELMLLTRAVTSEVH